MPYPPCPPLVPTKGLALGNPFPLPTHAALFCFSPPTCKVNLRGGVAVTAREYASIVRGITSWRAALLLCGISKLSRNPTGLSVTIHELFQRLVCGVNALSGGGRGVRRRTHHVLHWSSIQLMNLKFGKSENGDKLHSLGRLCLGKVLHRLCPSVSTTY